MLVIHSILCEHCFRLILHYEPPNWKKLYPKVFTLCYKVSKKCHEVSSRGVCEKGVLRNFTKFTGKHLCQSSFLIKSQALGLQLYLKRDSDTSVFLFLQNISGGCFWRPLSDFCNVKDITLLTLRKCHGLVYFIHLINLDLVVLENCVQM